MEIDIRLPPIAPENLTAEQRPLYEEMKAGVSAKYMLFTTTRENGAMLGPWNPWLHQPELGKAFWGLSQAMTGFDRLPDAVRQVAILAVGRIATLATGGRPVDLTEHEAAAFDVAQVLLKGEIGNDIKAAS